jgi:hypothetical protein
MVAWIVERYLPAATREDIDVAASRLAAVARALRARGVEIRYLGSTFVPAEEYCICRFEGARREEVMLAFEQAGLSYSRIVQAQELPSTPLATDRRTS